MTNEKALNFIEEFFERIQQAKCISEIEIIYNDPQIPLKNKMDDATYPKIEFSITQEDIQTLIDQGVLNGRDLSFEKNISLKLTDPLSKLLYATAWKNGDLKKISHIIKGIINVEEEDDRQEKALVFYQFGKYVTKRSGQPIIDQHVIRAFAIYQHKGENIDKWRKLYLLNKKHKEIINAYKKWLISDSLTQELKREKDYTYYIDQLLVFVNCAIGCNL